MPTPIYHQDVTYWGPPTPNGFGGETFSGSPVTFKGRWQDNSVVVTSEDGDDYTSNAQVLVPQDLEVGGYLYKGVSTETDPKVLGEEALRIQRFDSVPDLRNLTQIRKAYL